MWVTVVLLCGAALAIWETVLRPQKIYQNALTQLEQNPQAAEALLSELVNGRFGPRDHALATYARLLARQGRMIEAAGAFSLIADPHQIDAAELLTLAETAIAAGDAVLGRSILGGIRERTDLSPDDGRQAVSLLLRLSEFPVAAELATRMATEFPQAATSHEALGQVESALRHPAGAKVAFAQALEFADDRDIDRIRRQLVESLLALGDVAEADRQMNFLMERTEPTVEDLVKHAFVQRLQGNATAGWETIRQVRRLSPDHTGAMLVEGLLLKDLGRFQEAVDVLEELVSRDPYHKEAYYNLGQCHTLLGNKDAAAKCLQESSELHDAATAELELRRRLQTHPDDDDARRELATSLRRLGRRTEAEHVTHAK